MGISDLFKPNVEKLKEKRDFRGLIKALRHKERDIQSKASEALIVIGKPAIDPLIQVLKDENNKNILQVILKVLEKIGEPAEEHLIEAAMDEVNKAMSLANLGNYEGAIRYYDKALNLGGENYLIWYNKAACFFELRKKNESAICYNKALELNPEHANSWYGKGIVVGSLGAYDDAIKCFDKALMINPEDILALAGKATTLNYLRKFEEAERLFDKALKINPNDEKIIEQRRITRLIRAISKTMLSDVQHNILFNPTNEGYILNISAHLLEDYSPDDKSPIVKGHYRSKEALYSFVKRRIAEIYRIAFTSSEIKLKEVVVECRHGVRNVIIGGPVGDDVARTIYGVSIDGNKAITFDWTTISVEQIQRMWSVRMDIIPTIQIR